MRLEQDELVIDKWGYAIFAGVVGLAAAYSITSLPHTLGNLLSKLSPPAWFAILFCVTYVALLILEVTAQRIERKKELAIGQLSMVVDQLSVPDMSLSDIKKALEDVATFREHLEKLERSYQQLLNRLGESIPVKPSQEASDKI